MADDLIIVGGFPISMTLGLLPALTSIMESNIIDSDEERLANQHPGTREEAIMHILRHIGWLLGVLIGLIAMSLAVGCKSTDATGANPSQLVVDYRRTGGFAGVDDHLTIYSDRKATISRKTGEKTLVLDQNDYDRIVQQLEQAEFTKLNKEYIPANKCCDLFEYTIAYKGHEVRTMDTAVPDKLQPALKSLNDVVNSK